MFCSNVTACLWWCRRRRLLAKNIKENNILWWLLEGRAKGHLLNFEMSFWCLQFSPKTSENNSTGGTIVGKSNFFVHFLGELKIPKRHFKIYWPLDRAKKVLLYFALFYFADGSSKSHHRISIFWILFMYFIHYVIQPIFFTWITSTE